MADDICRHRLINVEDLFVITKKLYHQILLLVVTASFQTRLKRGCLIQLDNHQQRHYTLCQIKSKQLFYVFRRKKVIYFFCVSVIIQGVRHFDPFPLGYFKINWKVFGEEVKRMREINGMSIRDLQRLTEISASTISRCENGYSIEPDNFFTLLQFIGAQPNIPEKFLVKLEAS